MSLKNTHHPSTTFKPHHSTSFCNFSTSLKINPEHHPTQSLRMNNFAKPLKQVMQKKSLNNTHTSTSFKKTHHPSTSLNKTHHPSTSLNKASSSLNIPQKYENRLPPITTCIKKYKRVYIYICIYICTCIYIYLIVHYQCVRS